MRLHELQYFAIEYDFYEKLTGCVSDKITDSIIHWRVANGDQLLSESKSDRRGSI